MSRASSLRACNRAKRELRRERVPAAVALGLGPEPGGASLPQVGTFDCPCRRKTGKGSIQARIGYCSDCLRPFEDDRRTA